MFVVYLIAYMKKIIFGAVIITGSLVIPSVLLAQENLTPIIPEATEITVGESLSSETVPLTNLEEEIEILRIKEKESGFLGRFIIRLKIQELENKLNIKKALQ